GPIASTMRMLGGPGQDNVSRHVSDDARIVTVVGQSRVGRVTISEQGSPGFHVGSNESLNRAGGIVGDHGQAYAAGARIEVFRMFSARLRLIDVTINHLDRPDHEDLGGSARLEEGITLAERNFRLIDFDDAL